MNNYIQNQPCCDYQPKPGDITPNSPEFWGPRIWFILYFFISKINNLDNLKKYFEIIKFLHKILPCPICCNHVSEYMKREPLLQLENKSYSDDELNQIKVKVFLWLRKLQNIIRYNHKKELYLFTLESLNDYYENKKIDENVFRNIFVVLITFYKDNPHIKIILKEWMRNVEELKNEFVK